MNGALESGRWEAGRRRVDGDPRQLFQVRIIEVSGNEVLEIYESAQVAWEPPVPEADAAEVVAWGPPKVTHVYAGGGYTFARTDQGVVSFGQGSSKSLGHGDKKTAPIPKKATPSRVSRGTSTCGNATTRRRRRPLLSPRSSTAKRHTFESRKRDRQTTTLLQTRSGRRARGLRRRRHLRRLQARRCASRVRDPETPGAQRPRERTRGARVRRTRARPRPLKGFRRTRLGALDARATRERPRARAAVAPRTSNR